MAARIIPHGPSGWREKARIIEQLISERTGPPFLYGDILLLVPSARLRRAYGRLVLEIAGRVHGTGALTPPDIQTLHQFLQRLAARARGPALIDENSRLVLFEGVVKELIAGRSGFGARPGMLAPSLAAAVADMVEELSAAGVSPERLKTAVAASDVAGKPQVVLLLEAYERYAGILAAKGLTDPAGVLALVAERFDPAWLSDYRTIIIDGLYTVDALQAQVLRKMAGRDGCLFLIEAPSADSVRDAGEHHPLRLTREFAGRVGLLLGSGPGAADADDRFLASALFTDRPRADAAKDAPASFGRDIRLLSAVSVREEVAYIARQVKDAIGRGAHPDAILVAFPSLDDYGPLAEEIFNDFGIPYNRALGRQLGTSPVASAVVSLLQAVQDDCTGPSLLRVFSSAFLELGGPPGLPSVLDRFLRRQRITAGLARIIGALRQSEPSGEEPGALLAGLERLADALAPFSAGDTAPLTVWMDRLAVLIERFGLGRRAAAVKGPLNINLQAHRKLSETLASLRHAGMLFPEYRFTFSEWLFLLKKTFLHVRYQVPPDDEGGVQILGMEESAGQQWSEIYLGGLVDGAFPQRLPQNIFLPEAVLEPLGVATLETARRAAASHFYRLLLSAPAVTLTWPENVGDKPVVPSPFLQELAPLREAKVLNRGVGRTSAVQFSLAVADSRSVPELAKAVALAGTVEGLDSVLQADLAGMSGIRGALEPQPRTSAAAVPGKAAPAFRVTELDAYLACPYDYYVTRILGVAPLEEVSEDISPMDRGIAVHGILRDFYHAWDRPVTPEARRACRALLADLAHAAFTGSDTFRNRREKALFLAVMAERFLDAEEAFWRQGLRPAYLEQEIASFPLALSDGTEAELHGTIDRIDADRDGNFIIVDYKTGKYPQPRNGIEQEIFQLPVYAVMARQALSDTGGAWRALPPEGRSAPLQKPLGLAYYDLSGRTGTICRDVVLYDDGAGIAQTATKPEASRKTAEEFAAILSRSVEKARRAVEGIRSGDFAPRPKDENRCRYCANATLCRKET